MSTPVEPAAIDKTSDLAMPTDLDAKGQRAYEIITAYLQEHHCADTGGCKAFYAPNEWKARGEAYGAAARLIIVYDGGALRPVFSMDAAYELDCVADPRREPYAFYEGLQDKLLAAGLYFEECSRWYSAVYSVDPTA